jgi:acetolactate synthase-1/2/3 large subunit
VQSRADLLIAIGVRFSDRATGDVREYTKNCIVIHIDIDVAELDKNVDAKIGLCGDVKGILNELLKSVPKLPNPDWLAEIEQVKKEEEGQTNSHSVPKKIIETVQKYCSDRTVVATDVGQHQMWTMQHYKFEKPRTLLTSGGLGTMGFGLGAAIGGCIACGRKRTVLFTGDGSFGMNLNELATAVSQKLPLVIVIFNNGVLGMVRQWQTMFYEKRYSQTTLNRKTDFAALANAFGAKGFVAESVSELESVLQNKLSADCPNVVDCQIDIDEMVFPMIPPGGSVVEIITKWDETNG